MFGRVHPEDWHMLAQTVGTAIFVAVFAVMFLRVAFLTPRDKREHDALLPLENENAKDPNDNRK